MTVVLPTAPALEGRSLVSFDGASNRGAARLAADVVVVGSGPAGAAVARTAARGGASVLVVEEGPFVEPSAFPPDSFSAFASMYRDMGASVLLGRAPMPFVQGRVVGGTSVVNGAISWRLPEDVHARWIEADPALDETLSWDAIVRATDEVERDLHIAPTDPAIAGPKNLLMAKGADALGLEHRPIFRNVHDCRGLGRCLQGCPIGRKMSMDRTYLPDAVLHGARIACSTRIDRVLVAHGRAIGVVGRTAGGGRFEANARHAVVLAASAVQSPRLLLASGIAGGPVGEGFQCHPGVSVTGRFGEPIRAWEGATQGHEVIGLRKEGLKFEALGFGSAMVAARIKGVGSDLSRGLETMAHSLSWGAAVRAEARGRVGRWTVRFDLTRDDVSRFRRGVRVLGEMMLAAGAIEVSPGIARWHERVTDRATMSRLEDEAPLDPRAYAAVVTHMFGTCRMGSHPERSVVRPDFRHHGLEGLYVADSSVFPSNTGVNPQTAILALATLAGRRILSGS